MCPAFAAGLRTRPEDAAGGVLGGRMLSSVRGFHRFLLDEGLVGADVGRRRPNRRSSPAGCRRPSPWSRWRPLLATADGDDVRALRDKALLELLYATGARISEASALDVDDILASRGLRQRRHRATVRQGRQAAHRAARQLRPRRPRRLPGARPAGARRARPGHPGAVPRRARRAAVPAERVADRAGARRARRSWA